MSVRPVPLVDLVARAKVKYAGIDPVMTVTTVTIYGVALLTTAVFTVAAVVDEVLRSRRRELP